MEQRKLIKLGNSSFAIALPKRWVDKSGLKKGENVFLEENSGGEIIVKPRPSDNSNSKDIAISAENKDIVDLKRELRTAYVRGYTSFQINGIKDKENKNTLKEIIKDLIGFELVDSGEKEVYAKDFFSLGDTNIANFIRRMDNNIREIFELAGEEINKEKISSQKLKEIEEIDKDINKFYFLCSRIFLRGIDNPSILVSLKTTGIKLFNDWWFAFNLEALADNIKYLLKALQKSESKSLKEEIKHIYTEVQEEYTRCMDSFYKGDNNLAEKVISKTKELRPKMTKLEKENPLENPIVHELNQINRQVYQNAKMILYLKY